VDNFLFQVSMNEKNSASNIIKVTVDGVTPNLHCGLIKAPEDALPAVAQMA
jgi:hypothetical protein